MEAEPMWGHNGVGLPNALHDNDNGDPSTPRQPKECELQMPPVPRHTSLRLRRARLDQSAGAGAVHLPSDPQIPPRSTPRRFTDLRDRDPQTPQAQIRQIRQTSESKAQHEDDTIMSDAPTITTRPESVRSAASNSSANSLRSTHISVCEDCISPESEMQDPFDVVAHQFSDRREYLETPSKPERHGHHGSRPSAVPHARTVTWTRDMDNHLWTTYNEFLQDPTITPFKMLPGTLPPLGVSYRVAREARKTWPKYKPQRAPLPQRSRLLSNAAGDCLGVTDTDPDAGRPVSSNVTPNAVKNATVPPVKPAWPKSDASTRRRLKELCKRKFSIAPHYQRLIRSPSPKPGMPESDTTGLDTELIRTDGEPLYTEAPATSSPFATRDLEISLIAGSIPLEPRDPPVGDSGEPVSDNWFNELNMGAPDVGDTDETIIPPSQSASQQGAPATERDVPRLGSPFALEPSDTTPQGRFPPQGYLRSGPVSQSRLSANGQLAPDGRSQHHFEGLATQGGVPRSSFSESFRFQRGRWNPPHNSQQGPKSADHRSVVAGVSGSQRKLKQLFTPSSISGPASAPDLLLDQKGLLNSSSPPLLPLQGGDIARLGSPFKLNNSADPPHSQRNDRPSSVSDEKSGFTFRDIEQGDGSSSTVKGTPHKPTFGDR
ncbi:hypothetical protein KEM56_001270 [Ascosphaera pollenicola]|nr:hypothetical protein KEM56_001270 [Ascosphaera pollenicola]